MIRLLVLSLALTACQHIPASNPMQLGEPVPEHSGYREFCHRQPIDCTLPADKAMLKTLSKTNYAVNDAIIYKSDNGDLWHLAAQGKGDCEDYALKKRQILRALYPDFAPAFKIALLWTETGQYHAVLTASTSTGVYVLDNRYPEVTPWQKLPYKWDRIESPGQKNWAKIIG